MDDLRWRLLAGARWPPAAALRRWRTRPASLSSGSLSAMIPSRLTGRFHDAALWLALQRKRRVRNREHVIVSSRKGFDHVDVVGIALTAVIGTVVNRLANAVMDAAVNRYPRPQSIGYVPRRLELQAAPLTSAVQRRSRELNVDERWHLANDAFRRTSQSKVRRAGREDLLRQASYDYNWIRRTERPGSLPQVHSALMYALTTSLLGEDVEALMAVRESLPGKFNGDSLSFDAVEAVGNSRRYDAANAYLKITVRWPPAGPSYQLPDYSRLPDYSGYRTNQLDGPRLRLHLVEPEGYFALGNPSDSAPLSLANVITGTESHMPRPPTAETSISDSAIDAAADWLGRRQAPRNHYQLCVLDALREISPFSASEGSEAAAADAWIEAGMPRLLPVYIDRHDNERSPEQIIAKLKPFTFEKVLFITDGTRFDKGLQQLDGKLVLTLLWRQGDGPFPIVAATRRLVAS
jgi:hypothetical protein